MSVMQQLVFSSSIKTVEHIVIAPDYVETEWTFHNSEHEFTTWYDGILFHYEAKDPMHSWTEHSISFERLMSTFNTFVEFAKLNYDDFVKEACTRF